MYTDGAVHICLFKNNLDVKYFCYACILYRLKMTRLKRPGLSSTKLKYFPILRAVQQHIYKHVAGCMLIQICTFSNSSSSLPKPLKYLQQLPKDYVVCNILQVLRASFKVYQQLPTSFTTLPATLRVYQ